MSYGGGDARPGAGASEDQGPLVPAGGIPLLAPDPRPAAPAPAVAPVPVAAAAPPPVPAAPEPPAYQPPPAPPGYGAPVAPPAYGGPAAPVHAPPAYGAPPPPAYQPPYVPAYSAPEGAWATPPPAPVAVAPPPAPWAPTPAPGPVFQPFDPRTTVGAAKPPREGVKREATVVAALLGVVALVLGVQQFRGRGGTEPEAAPVAEAAPFTLPPAIEDLNAPPTIGGEQRNASRALRALGRELRTILPNNGRHAEIEFYGNGAPVYAIIAGNLTAKTSRGYYRELAAEDGSGWLREGRQYANGMVCGRYAEGAFRGSLCTWSGKVSDGVIFGFTGPDPAALARVSARARADLERGR